VTGPLVALVDGPLADGALAPEAADPSRREAEHGRSPCPAARHAAAMAAAIAAHAPGVRLASVVVFEDRLVASAAAVARALDAAGETGAAIIHCSFGLARPDAPIAQAVAALLGAGRLVVAAAPARGGPVWPAALPGVIGVQGDARCGPQDWSRLDLPHAAFGACPSLAADPAILGASVAAARLTGMIAAHLGTGAAPAEALALLRAQARFQGRERRGPPAADRLG
jgi:hypothetical protein